MKRKITIPIYVFFSFVILLSITAAKVVDLPTQYNSATVEKIDGLYVFMLSEPINEYEVLGTIKKRIALTGQPREMLNSMIKKAKKQYPQSDAIIFTAVAMDELKAIQFKIITNN